MRPELQEKRQRLKAAANDLLGDYVEEEQRLKQEVAELESALAMKKAEWAMIDDMVTQLSRSAEALDRE